MSEDHEDAIVTQASLFRKRAERCRVEAYVFLLAIFLVLVVGVIVFWTASRLAVEDISRAQSVENIAIRELVVEIDELQSFRRSELDQSDLKDPTGEIQKRIKELDDLTSKYASSAGESLVLFALIQANLTRFGTLAVAIFAAAMFLGLNRYSVRLAVYYDWQADRCILYSERENSDHTTDKLAEAAPPLDFGKMPSTPLSGVVSAANRAKGWFRRDDNRTS